jgi:Spy/CpxP family protein refolding chaperone
MAPPPRPSWRNPRIWLILLLVFLCGSLAGALAFRYGAQNPPPSPAPYWSEAGKEISLQRLQRELDLTEKQSQEIALILDDFVKYMHSLQVQMDEVRADGKRRILSVLDERQKKKFHEMLSGLSERKSR